jgi:Flp pilus assembly CpaE family ATPase
MISRSLATAIVSPDPLVLRQMQGALDSCTVTEAVWSLSEYPEFPALERLKEAASGCIMFLDFSDTIRAERIAVELDRDYPQVSVVAVLNGGTKDDVVALMRLGIREIIGNPISSSEVKVAFVRASKRLNPAAAAGGDIYAFLPARVGAGATTTVISTAAAVARLSKQPTLLLDFDFRFGISSFLLKLDGRRSVQDALKVSAHLDEDFWEKLVTRRGGMDILGSAPDELPSEPRADQCSALLSRAQSQYGAIFLDLPGAMDSYELEALHQAKDIFLVLTSDMAGLHMAKRKSEALRRLHLTAKASAIISQADGRATLPLADIEKLLQLPVRFVLPRDEPAVTQSAMQGVAVQSDSKLGAQIETIAKAIAGTPVAKPSPAQRTHRFLEFFSVSPDRDRHRWKD